MLLTDAPAPAGTDAELAEIVRKTLDRSEQPLTLSQLRSQLTGPFRRSPDELGRVVDSLVERGVVFRLPKFGRSERFWTRDLDTYARQVFVEALSKKSLTRSQLKQKVKTRLQGLSEPKQRAIFDELRREGAIQSLPAFVGTRTERFSSAAPDPVEYVEDALQRLCEKLAKAGISRDGVYAAARKLVGSSGAQEQPAQVAREEADTAPPLPTPERRPSLEELLLERMAEIEPAARQGAMVYVPELRRALDFQPAASAEFDEAVWALVRQGRVALHKHGHPAGLPADERAALIADERGNHYHGISLRTS